MTIAAAAPNLAPLIRRCVAGQDLSRDEMRDAIAAIMGGQASPAQVAALLIALSLKGETAEEIVGAVQAMRASSLKVRCDRRPLMDVCGTGGDGLGSFNISTAVAFVVAGAGVAVAKHGNRAMSSRCGSADVLESLGVKLDAGQYLLEDLLDRQGIAFLFAQSHHPAMRFVAPVRREIGVRTLFNVLGPLTNPADPTRQLIGVAHERSLLPVAQALCELGSDRAAVVRAEDGMDEVSLACATRVLEWTGEQIIEYNIEPEMFGIQRRKSAEIAGTEPQANAALIRDVLVGRPGPHRDVVLLNAALALRISGSADDLHDACGLAKHSIDSGAALRKLNALIKAGGT